MEDFCSSVIYVMTNTDLVEDDPRLKLIEWAKTLKETDGWNSGNKRLKEGD